MLAVLASCSRTAQAQVLQRSRKDASLAAAPLGLAHRPRCQRPSRAAVYVAATAQPVLRAAGRLAVRAAGTTGLVALARSALTRSGMGPVLFVSLLAYSIGVTIYVASKSSQAEHGEVGEAELEAHVESPAEAVAAAIVAPPDKKKDKKPQAAAAAAILEPPTEVAAAAAAAATLAAQPPEQKARDKGAVCKVCNGTGKVAYENHMTTYEGTVCPCCLGKGRVRNTKGDLLSCLLSFDP